MAHYRPDQHLKLKALASLIRAKAADYNDHWPYDENTPHELEEIHRTIICDTLFLFFAYAHNYRSKHGSRDAKSIIHFITCYEKFIEKYRLSLHSSTQHLTRGDVRILMEACSECARMFARPISRMTVSQYLQFMDVYSSLSPLVHWFRSFRNWISPDFDFLRRQQKGSPVPPVLTVFPQTDAQQTPFSHATQNTPPWSLSSAANSPNPSGSTPLQAKDGSPFSTSSNPLPHPPVYIPTPRNTEAGTPFSSLHGASPSRRPLPRTPNVKAPLSTPLPGHVPPVGSDDRHLSPPPPPPHPRQSPRQQVPIRSHQESPTHNWHTNDLPNSDQQQQQHRNDNVEDPQQQQRQQQTTPNTSHNSSQSNVSAQGDPTGALVELARHFLVQRERYLPSGLSGNQWTNRDLQRYMHPLIEAGYRLMLQTPYLSQEERTRDATAMLGESRNLFDAFPNSLHSLLEFVQERCEFISNHARKVLHDAGVPPTMPFTPASGTQAMPGSTPRHDPRMGLGSDSGSTGFFTPFMSSMGQTTPRDTPASSSSVSLSTPQNVPMQNPPSTPRTPRTAPKSQPHGQHSAALSQHTPVINGSSPFPNTQQSSTTTSTNQKSLSSRPETPGSQRAHWEDLSSRRDTVPSGIHLLRPVHRVSQPATPPHSPPRGTSSAEERSTSDDRHNYTLPRQQGPWPQPPPNYWDEPANPPAPGGRSSGGGDSHSARGSDGAGGGRTPARADSANSPRGSSGTPGSANGRSNLDSGGGSSEPNRSSGITNGGGVGRTTANGNENESNNNGGNGGGSGPNTDTEAFNPFEWNPDFRPPLRDMHPPVCELKNRFRAHSFPPLSHPDPSQATFPGEIHPTLRHSSYQYRFAGVRWDIFQKADEATFRTQWGIITTPLLEEVAVQAEGDCSLNLFPESDTFKHKVWIEANPITSPDLKWWMDFGWGPIVIQQKEEITLRDVLAGIHDFFDKPLTLVEYRQAVNIHTGTSHSNLDRMNVARLRRAKSRGLEAVAMAHDISWPATFKRCDIMGSHTAFYGLQVELRPNGTWVLLLSLGRQPPRFY